MTSRYFGGVALIVLVAAVASGCKRAEPVADQPAVTPAAAWATERDAFIEDRLSSNPPFAVDSGRHEFDGKLPDWSKDGIAGNIARLHAARDAAAKVDTTHLEPALAFERDYMIARIDRELFWLETSCRSRTRPGTSMGSIRPCT